VAGFAATFAIEFFQAVFLPGRTPDPVDMVANTAGALVGYWLSLIRPPAPRRRRGR
jgi:VanZ family protein